jgi:N-acetylglutamate synthase-like GNAT family acetyltransferase
MADSNLIAPYSQMIRQALQLQHSNLLFPGATHMFETFERGEYSISTDPGRLDLNAIHAYLARAYWCEGIPRQTLERAITNSLCFGLFHAKDQVGLARVVTDSATYAYLCDVYVLEAHRGKGLAKWLMECVMAHPALQGLRRFTLATRDAHGLYRQFGFRELSKPESKMEILRSDIYRQTKPD